MTHNRLAVVPGRLAKVVQLVACVLEDSDAPCCNLGCQREQLQWVLKRPQFIFSQRHPCSLRSWQVQLCSGCGYVSVIQ